MVWPQKWVTFTMSILYKLGIILTECSTVVVARHVLRDISVFSLLHDIICTTYEMSTSRHLNSLYLWLFANLHIRILTSCLHCNLCTWVGTSHSMRQPARVAVATRFCLKNTKERQMELKKYYYERLVSRTVERERSAYYQIAISLVRKI